MKKSEFIQERKGQVVSDQEIETNYVYIWNERMGISSCKSSHQGTLLFEGTNEECFKFIFNN